MRFLLLSFLILSASCGKKENSVLAVKSTSSVTQKSFITISHPEGDSRFREKLLNAVVEEKFPSADNKYALAFREELENAQLNDSEFNLYKENENSMAKVVVTYTDRTEIYFLPEGIALDKIAARLDIKPEHLPKFRILKHSYTITGKGQVYYLVDASYEELMLNDQSFFETEINFKNQFTAKTISLEPGTRAEVFVNYQAYLEQMGQVTRQGRSGRMTRDMIEAGVDACTYKTYVPTGTFEKFSDFSLVDLGFALKINGKTLSLNEMKNQKLKEGFLKVNVAATDMIKNGKLEAVVTNSTAIQKEVNGFGYEGYCASMSDRSTISLTSRVDFQVMVKIYGRGEKLRAVSL